MDANNYITIRSYHDHIMGELVIAALHAGGIKTFRFDENNSMLPSENVEIKVHESDVEAALEIISAQEVL